MNRNPNFWGGPMTKSAVLRAVLAALILAASATLGAAQQAATVIYRFKGTDGFNPNGGLVFDRHGNLVGTAALGGQPDGITGEGTVFQLTRPATGILWSETVLHRFATGEGFPESGVDIDNTDAIFGTTPQAAGHDGSVFELSSPSPLGQRIFRPIFIFGPNPNTGVNPMGGVLETHTEEGDAVYGTAAQGGSHLGGVIFELFRLSGQGHWDETTTHNFCSEVHHPTNYCLDGSAPIAPLTLGRDNALYGTTLGGGGNDDGTVFKFGKGGLEVLYDFCGEASCRDGANPASRVIFDPTTQDILYGTTQNCLTNGPCKGTVYALSFTGESWHITVLHRFCNSKTPEGFCADGDTPSSGLVIDNTGALYGLTHFGGKFNGGVLYKLVRTGNFRVLYSFAANKSGLPSDPVGDLLQDPSTGTLYGATLYGGNLCRGSFQGTCGTIFQLIP
jgi:uncharacterized repeat protein (TIGR03803 family)